VAELSKLGGVAKGTVVALEGGAGNPTIETVYALAGALGCGLSDLLEGAPDPMVVELPASKRSSRIGALRGRVLQRFAPTGAVEVFEILVSSGGLRRSRPHAYGVYEHVWVADGRIELGPSEEPFELSAGDYVCFPAWQDHHYRALDPPVRMLMLLSFVRAVPDGPVLRHLE
jgi:quercetin dioxygenase-like cupin family protein/DNA-binding XRE family transcriptional regulator